MQPSNRRRRNIAKRAVPVYLELRFSRELVWASRLDRDTNPQIGVSWQIILTIVVGAASVLANLAYLYRRRL